jgi:hypothetical protein
MKSNRLGPPGGDGGKHTIEMRGNRPGAGAVEHFT